MAEITSTDENATVRIIHPDGSHEDRILDPGGFIVCVGRDRYVAHEQFWSNGTSIVTIKKREDGVEPAQS